LDDPGLKAGAMKKMKGASGGLTGAAAEGAVSPARFAAGLARGSCSCPRTSEL